MQNITHNGRTQPLMSDAAQSQRTMPKATGGLPIRTDLRAGLAWDDLDDQAQSLWGGFTGAVSNVTSGVGSAISNVTDSLGSNE